MRRKLIHKKQQSHRQMRQKKLRLLKLKLLLLRHQNLLFNLQMLKLRQELPLLQIQQRQKHLLNQLRIQVHQHLLRMHILLIKSKELMSKFMRKRFLYMKNQRLQERQKCNVVFIKQEKA